MSYPFPYALGICLATLALLGSLTWLYVIMIKETVAWLVRRDIRQAKREAAEKEAYAAALACLAKLEEKSRTR